MGKSGLDQEQISQYKKFMPEVSGFLSGLSLDKFFGQEIALAIYSGKISSANLDASTLLDIASNIILVTRVKPETDFTELINKIYGKFNQKVTAKSEKYQGHEIKSIELGGNLSITYVKIKDLVVIGLGQKAARTCLDVFAKTKPPLSQDKNYLFAISQLPKLAETVAYANLAAVFSDIKRLTAGSGSSGQETSYSSTLKNLDKFAGFKTLSFASVSGKISKSKLIITFDKNRIDPLLAKTYSLKPQVNHTLAFIPKDIIGYQWTSFDPKIFWENIMKGLSEAGERNASEGPSPSDITAGIENAIGVSITKDFIPALGNEAGGFLADVDLNGPIPIPEILLFVKINKKAVIDKIMSNLTEKNNIPIQSEDYKYKTIQYVSLPFGMDLQPGYCFLDNYILIATSHKLLKSCIDVYNNKSLSLATDKDFQVLNAGLADKNNAIQFLKTEIFLDKLKGVANWVVGWMSLMSSNAQNARKEAEQQLNALNSEIKTAESELSVLKTKLQSLEEEITNIKNKGADISAKELEKASLDTEIEDKEKEIGELTEQKKEFESVAQDQPTNKIDPSLIKTYLDELIYPILDGLKMIKATSSTTIFKDGAIEVLSASRIEQ
jgi:hypothetical protein